eukprot:Rmarinus@m.9798
MSEPVKSQDISPDVRLFADERDYDFVLVDPPKAEAVPSTDDAAKPRIQTQRVEFNLDSLSHELLQQVSDDLLKKGLSPIPQRPKPPATILPRARSPGQLARAKSPGSRGHVYTCEYDSGHGCGGGNRSGTPSSSRVRAGRRRRRRYMQERYIFKDYKSDAEDDSDDETFRVEHRSAFQNLFTDPASSEAWDVFSSLPEEKQYAILHSQRDGDARRKGRCGKSRSYSGLDAIPRHVRSALWAEVKRKSEFVATAEEIVLSLLELKRGRREIVVTGQDFLLPVLNSSYYRLLFHGVCRYYACTSQSVCLSNGDRALQVKARSKASERRPAVNLTDLAD